MLEASALLLAMANAVAGNRGMTQPYHLAAAASSSARTQLTCAVALPEVHSRRRAYCSDPDRLVWCTLFARKHLFVTQYLRYKPRAAPRRPNVPGSVWVVQLCRRVGNLA